MSKNALTFLEAAKALLLGKASLQIVKAEEPDTTDPDARVGDASAGEDELSEAKKEAQAGQAAAPGQPMEGKEQVPGTGEEPDGDENGGEANGGHEEPDGDEVSKAELLQSMRYIALSRGISPQDFAKAFSGLEGDPAISQHPVGKGEELLEAILKQGKDQASVLEKVAESILAMAQQTVSLQCEVAKAQKETEDTRKRIDNLPRTAPARAPKAEVGEFAKAMPPAMSKPSMTGEELFNKALKGEIPFDQVAVMNRRINYGLANN